ncbi:GNAT family N-acetyltransferase [Streptomyces sp. NPDC057654]|uniref:GNAT family N-acetyltransferase n=1 Tax=Streptomyces sp. NPDC057654 TaxID=3346196 RepID=UPI0036ABBD9F
MSWSGGGTTPLASLLTDLAKGVFPPCDGRVDVVPQPSRRDAGVLSLTGYTMVFTDAEAGWVRGRLPPGDLSAPLNPPFLSALCARTDRVVDNIDLLTVAHPLPGPPPLPLTPTRDRTHPRIVRALRHRDDVRAWTHPGGTLLIGRGVAGRWEMAVEVAPRSQRAGLGRLLATAARHLVPPGEPLWAQIAPGNAASVRTLLAAGFTPVGAEALLVAR